MEKKSIQHAFWALAPDKAINLLETAREGLSEKEAQKRLKIFGKNVFEKDDRITKFQLILNQFKSPLIFILIIAGSVTLFFKDWWGGVFIFLAVAVNTALGFYQENRAEEALEKLKTYIIERVRVIREGVEREIPAEEVVPGDIMHLISGERISADARLVFVNALNVDEAVLTGESLPVVKNVHVFREATELAERENMVHAGTLIVGGYGIAVVTSTGIETQIGQIAKLVAETKREKTPLQKSIGKLAWFIAAALTLVTVGIFFLGISRGESIFDTFLISVAVAVSAIPEALPVSLTVILAVGVERLARRKGIVRKLAAAESLGSTTVILTDKTGTLTQGKMEMRDIITYDDLSSEKRQTLNLPKGLSKQQLDILKLALVNTNVFIENPKDSPERWRASGNPFEVNILKYAARHGIFVDELSKHADYHRILEFSSEHKFSASFVASSDEFEWDDLKHKNFLVALGAPEILLEKSKTTKERYAKIHRTIEDLSVEGMRLVGIATKIVKDRKEVENIKPDDLSNLQFTGVIAFYDPLRPEINRAMRKVADFGVRAVMITGDLRGTAISVARKLGWKIADGNVLTGAEIKTIDDKKLLEDLPNIKVFARVTPGDKARIAKLYKRMGESVAMTGDGVNDVPSLKAVDIGVAVGSGTDVAKEVADLVLLDDNFQTIVAAIEEGRRILSNIKKATVFLLSNALKGVFLIGGSLLFSLTLPMTAIQILWVNFFTDSIPAAAYAFEKNYDNGLRRSKKKTFGGVLGSEVLFFSAVLGIVTSALLFALYWYLLKIGHEPSIVRSFIFATYSIYTLFVTWPLRSFRRSIFQFNPFGNRWILAGIGIGIFLTAIAIYAPFMQNILNTQPLPLLWIGLIVVWTVINIALVEIIKLFFRKT